MEKNTLTPMDYNFIAVPTNLYFALDNNLRVALTTLVQLSSVFADQDGFFFRTNEDLQADFKMGKNLTIAVLESLYQYGLLQVKSVGFTKKNTKRQVNFFKVNFSAFKDYEQYNIYTITKNEELHLETVDYKAKDFKVTYTASTETTSVSPSIEETEEIPSEVVENVSEPKETALNDTVETDTPTEVEETTDEPMEDLPITDVYDGECPLLQEELDEILNSTPAVEEKSYENNTFRLGSDGKRIETASVIPTDLGKVEKRFIKRNIDQDEVGKCYDLCNRFCSMDFPNAVKCEEYMNKANDYFYKQYTNGKIDESDYKRLISVTTKKRWEKFSSVC